VRFSLPAWMPSPLRGGKKKREGLSVRSEKGGGKIKAPGFPPVMAQTPRWGGGGRRNLMQEEEGEGEAVSSGFSGLH